jgi:hypothetical protein
MGLTIVALLLFLAMVVAWVVLSGSMMALPIEDSPDPMLVRVAGQTAESYCFCRSCFASRVKHGLQNKLWLFSALE